MSAYGSGAATQVLDYLPYGGVRYASSTAQTNEKHQFIGQYTDYATSLSYLQARYFASARGQFLSEDPVFWGDFREMKLENPQSLNSYSYANGNPITNKDPDGKQAAQVLTLLQSLAVLLTNYIAYLSGPLGQVGISNAVSAAPTVTNQSSTFTQRAGAIAVIGLSLAPGGAGGSSGKAAARGVAGAVDEIAEVAKSSGKVTWPSGAAGAQVIDGIKYSDHALDSMAPAGMIGAKGVVGRGVPPSAVKNAIEYGAKASSYDNRTVHTYQNVRVVTEANGTVVTVVKTGH